MNTDIDKIIQKGLSFIRFQQRPDGSFFSWTTDEHQTFCNAITHQSVFPTCLILGALADVDAYEIRTKAVAYLLQQKSEYWSYNYWERNSEESIQKPFPEDLDDTFCALAGIQLFDDQVIDGDALAKIVHLLTLAEQREGGPYYTWLTPSDADHVWKDVDVAVNSNVAFFYRYRRSSYPMWSN